MIALHLRTTNDTNGNPRRLYVLIDPKDGEIREVIDEGYEGSGALRKVGSYVMGPSIDITPAAYRDLKKYRPR